MSEINDIQIDAAEDGFNCGYDAGIDYCKKSGNFLDLSKLSEGDKEMLKSMYDTCLKKKVR